MVLGGFRWFYRSFHVLVTTRIFACRRERASHKTQSTWLPLTCALEISVGTDKPLNPCFYEEFFVQFHRTEQ